MTDLVAAVLSRAFVRVYRSFGQYLNEASPYFDVGEETIRAIMARESAAASKLGEYLIDELGSVPTANYSAGYSDIHFLNASYILVEWKKEQEALIAGLEADRALIAGSGDTGLALLDEIIGVEKETLKEIENLSQTAPSAA